MRQNPVNTTQSTPGHKNSIYQRAMASVSAPSTAESEARESESTDFEMAETPHHEQMTFQASISIASAPTHAPPPSYYHDFRVRELLEPEKQLYTMPELPEFVSDVRVESQDDPDDNAIHAADLEVEDDEGPSPGDEGHGDIEGDVSERPGKLHEAPTLLMASDALKDIQNKLQIPRKIGAGYHDPDLDVFVRTRMEGMCTMLNLYTNPHSVTVCKWAASSVQASISLGRGRYLNPYGDWNETMLVDEDLMNDVNLHLQELGKGITAQKLVSYLTREDVREKHGITCTISERTARRYLKLLGYRWETERKGQYADVKR
ncbi:hypothetical protein FPV67DRAFT_1673914 [Lyophyllum atratum]|nr:hypothetical protein FPV67DRAFT_1673914 [Lyophyllum atratum]